MKVCFLFEEELEQMVEQLVAVVRWHLQIPRAGARRLSAEQGQCASI